MHLTGAGGALLVIAIAIVGLLALADHRAPEAAGRAIIFYVSPDGNDEWSGKQLEPNTAGTDGPFASITRARDAIRELRVEAQLPGPITIMLRGGTYWLSEPLVFEPQDSGSEECSISYEAYGDERPIFSGGRPITGWQEAADGLWAAAVPAAQSGDWYFHQLFVNGRRAIRARAPNEGFYEAAKPIEPKSGKGFYFQPGHIKIWERISDVDVVLLHHWDASRLPIEYIDEAANLVTFVGKRFHYYAGWRNASRYYVENAFELLDAPGEWYLNRDTGVVYYRPRPGEDMTQAEVVAPVLNTIVRFAGDWHSGRLVSHIHLRGIALHHADWVRRDVAFTEGQGACRLDAAVEMTSAVNCSFEDCEIAHVGENAFWVRSGCQKNRIVGCHIYDLGGSGVMIGQMSKVTSDIEEARENELSDCHIHDGGIIWKSGVAIWINRSGYNLISHNHVHNFDYTGISVGMQWQDYDSRCRDNVVEFNYIHHVCEVMADGGGIYTMGNMPGTVLRNNLIHDVYGDEYTPRLCRNRGIFLDGASGGLLIRDNIVYRTLGGPLDPYTENTKTPNTYENNIFALPRQGSMSWNRRADNNNPTHHNIVYAVKTVNFHIGQQRPPERYAELVNDNLYYHPGGQMRFNNKAFGQWQALGFDTRSIVADPLFTDPENGDFSLPIDSPAWDIGFEPIDMSTVGPRRELKWQAPNLDKE